MAAFLEKQRTNENYWRAVILFGRNVATYKFALARSLLELAPGKDSFVRLEELAVPFSRYIVEHLRSSPKQATSTSSRFLDACRQAAEGQLTQDQLVPQTVSLGFNNVIDAFHIVNRAEIPVRFFIDERSGGRGGIRLTDELLRMRESFQFSNLPSEVEARWRLVETAWQLGLPRGLVVGVESDGSILTAPNGGRRVPLTRSRDALNGYQKGKCFYCFGDVSISSDDDLAADVDHFFPRVLMGLGLNLPLDGVWNLVLACRNCNRGVDGKSSRLPTTGLLQRLHARNEFLIGSHHPLRETLIAQTGADSVGRSSFLSGVYDAAWEKLIHTWQPRFEHEAAF